MDSSSVGKSLCFAGVASSVAAAATHPIDTLKVKIQVKSNLSATRLLANILTTGKTSSLFWGIEAALLRSVTYGSIRYAIYNPIKDLIGNSDRGQVEYPFLTKIVSGCLSGCLASALCNPTDLVKVRMQTGSHAGYGTLSSAVSSIVSREGIRGLWTGTGPTCLRATVLAAAELSTYDQTKESLLTSGYFKDGIAVHFAASLFAGFVAAAASNPFDFAKSRIMNQPINPCDGILYKGTVDCMIKCARNEGVGVLWSGFLATFTRLGPNIVITFTMMEQLRNIFDPQSNRYIESKAKIPLK